jgi:hypothetical protein
MTRRAWTDAEMLTALDLRDREGLTYRQIGARIGRGRSSVAICLNRVDAETDLSDPHGTQDGTMPPRWWERAA